MEEVQKYGSEETLLIADAIRILVNLDVRGRNLFITMGNELLAYQKETKPKDITAKINERVKEGDGTWQS